MTLSVAHVGNTAQGASNFLMLSNSLYTVPVTVGDGWLTAIEAALSGTAGSGVSFSAAIYADDGAGAPGLLKRSFTQVDTFVIDGSILWVSFPTMIWLTSGLYHIGINFMATTSPRLFFDGGVLGDGHTVNPVVRNPSDGDYSSTVVTATSAAYSIRGIFAVEAAPEVELSLDRVQEEDLAHDLVVLPVSKVDLSLASEIYQAHNLVLITEPAIVFPSISEFDQPHELIVGTEPVTGFSFVQESDTAHNLIIDVDVIPEPEIFFTAATVTSRGLDLAIFPNLLVSLVNVQEFDHAFSLNIVPDAIVVPDINPGRFYQHNSNRSFRSVGRSFGNSGGSSS